MSSPVSLDKGKGKAVINEDEYESDSGSSSSSGLSTSDSDSDSDDSVSPEFLDSLLEMAKEALTARVLASKALVVGNDDVLMLGQEKVDEPIPRLDPGPSLPRPYFSSGTNVDEASVLICDPEAEQVANLASTSSIAKTLPIPPELSKKTGLPLTKAEKKALKDATAGPKWFDLPAPAAADLPRLAREVDAMRLRNALDPKRFYRKEDTKAGPLPKHFAIGHIMSTSSPFGGPSRDDLPRAARKRTIVDELMDDDQARTYAKRKFNELQGVRGERGRGTWKRKMAGRERKW